MKINSHKPKRVYLTATDARTKKSKCATVEGVTPTQLIRALKRLAREMQQKGAA